MPSRSQLGLQPGAEAAPGRWCTSSPSSGPRRRPRRCRTDSPVAHHSANVSARRWQDRRRDSDRRRSRARAGRARPRAAGGRRGRARAGLHPGRRGHRQDPGDHPPHRLRGAHRRGARRASCSRSPSPPARPASCAPGCARSARRACRPAPSTPRRCASCSTSRRASSAARMPDVARQPAAAGRQRGRPAAAARRPRRAARPRRRDRLGQVGARHAGRLRRAARARPAASIPLTPGHGRRGLRRVRAGQAARRRQLDFADLLLIMAGAIEEYRDVAEEVRAPLPALRRRRVPGRLPAAAAAARRLARRPRRPVRGRRRQPDHLLLRRRDARAPARASAAASPTRCVVRLRARLPLDPAGRRAGQPAGRRRRATAGAARWSASAPDGPEPTFAEYDDEPAEAAAVAARCRAADRRGHAGGRDRGAVPDQRAVGGLRAGAGRRPACRTCCAAASGSSTGPRSARPGCCCAARRGPTTTATPLPRRGARGARPAWTGTPTTPPPGGAARERWESLAALVSLADDLRRRAARRAAGRPRRRARRSAPTPSTRRPCRASRSRRCTRPRAWSGTPSSWSA